jgi:pimeloyl-ACP methyl ester carboxylesterase
MLKKILWGVAALIGFAAIAGAVLYVDKPLRLAVFLKPWHAASAETMPPAPDYTKDEAWAALPDHLDNADVVPAGSGLTDNQAAAKVDVFFIHPTTYYSKDGWNARYDEPGTTMELLESGVLRFQASAFNGCCRIFAPRYRQATLYSFIGKGEAEKAALDFAYQDVARAFDEFIAHRNDGRPFIIAAHSQGSLHAMRLLREKIAGTPLAKRLVAAYVIGSAMPRDADIAGIPPCASPTETSCYINWNSVRDVKDREGWTQTGTMWIDGNYTLMDGRPNTCVNPLTWTLDGAAPASANLGSLPFVDKKASFPAARVALTGAKCEKGLLVVTPPADEPGFTFGVNEGDYHIYDYNLFYMNIRANVAQRIAAFEK